jgi:hypothetical protein
MKLALVVAAGLCVSLSTSVLAESLGEHPAVLVKRHAAKQPAVPAEQNFYMHPAHLDWLTQAPGEETATAARDDKGHKVIAAQRSVAPTTTY